MKLEEIETVIDAFKAIIKEAGPGHSVPDRLSHIQRLAKHGIKLYTNQHGNKAELEEDRESHKI